MRKAKIYGNHVVSNTQKNECTRKAMNETIKNRVWTIAIQMYIFPEGGEGKTLGNTMAYST
jgi:hypothetical protein